MPDEGIPLDDEAARLFQELGGIDTADRVRKVLHNVAGLSEGLSEEENRLDGWRVLLVQFASIIAGLLDSIRSTGSADREHTALLMAVLSQLSEMPDGVAKLLIRYRGMPLTSKRASEKRDYLILSGSLVVDIPTVVAVAERQGETASHLPGNVTKAFQALSSMSISTVYVDLTGWGEETEPSLSKSLQALGRYFTTLASDPATADEEDTGNGPPAVVLDEHDKPDLNLTMLAAVNGLNRRTIQGLVRRISAMMDQPALAGYPNVYSTLFAFRKLREQLTRIPLEINNPRWLVPQSEQASVPKGQAQLARVVSAETGIDPQEAAQILQNVYGDDYGSVEASAMGARLENLTDFLERMQKSEDYQSIEDEVIDNVGKRLDTVPDETLSALVFRGDAVQVQNLQGRTVWKKLHGRLSDIVFFLRHRVGTKNKIRLMMHQAIDFDGQDYETVARDFGLTIEDAKKLLELLRSCFDETGRFRRRYFEENAPAFAGYDEKVFDFLWHYLKEVNNRKDRVAFLNSLQLLIAKMERKQTALKLVLEDLTRSPDTVDFHDRNALMIAILLLRKYNQELQHDIERSPEEILLVVEGLDQEIVKAATDHIDLNLERTYKKVRAIHKRLKEALDPGKAGSDPMPITYLTSLEREFYIFMSLVGSSTCHKIVQNAVKEYGDPDSEIYWLEQSKENQDALFKLLQVAIRGLGRFRQRSDVSLLRTINNRRGEFLSNKGMSVPEDAVTRVIRWTDSAIEAIAEGKRKKDRQTKEKGAASASE